MPTSVSALALLGLATVANAQGTFHGEDCATALATLGPAVNAACCELMSADLSNANTPDPDHRSPLAISTHRLHNTSSRFGCTLSA